MNELIKHYNIALLIFALLVLIRFGNKIRFSYKKRRHQRNVSAGERAILKLKSFSGEFKNQQRLTYLRKIDPYVFEELVLSALANQGYVIKRNKSYSGDGGMDGMCEYENKTYLIQAKRYSNFVRTSHINEFVNLVELKKTDGGYFVHTGKTTKNSYTKHKNTNIKIISGQRLVDLILFEPIKKEAFREKTGFISSL